MNSIPQAVAWTLIHFCWQAAAVAAVFRVVSIALARRTAKTRYLTALGSLLLMLVLAACTFAWELRSDPASIPFANNTTISAAPLAGDFPRSAAPGFFATQPVVEHISLSNLLPWIDGLWLAGVLVLSIRGLGGWWYLHRLRLDAIDEIPAPIRASFDRICVAFNLRREALLRLTDAIDGPMTMGVLRAIVLLPVSALTSLGPEELEVVFAHELAHIRRADFFWNVLQTIAETLFFFHPAVWWISSRVRQERELCCDDLALKVCPNPIAYAQALFRIEEQRSNRLHLAMALDGHASHPNLLARIERILGEPMPRVPSRSVRPISLAAAIAGLIVLLLPVPHVLAKLAPEQQPAPAPAAAEVQISAAQIRANADTIVHATTNAIVGSTTNAIVHADAGAIAAAVEPSASAIAEPLAAPAPEPTPQDGAQSESKPDALAKPHTDYIDSMKAAGYDVDLDKLIAMKIQNITPEYARAMANTGFGKPSADELVACKIQGVTPEYLTQLKQQGFEIKSFNDAISFRIFGVTPEFAAGMKAAGFGGLTTQQMVALRVQGVTPEYARKLKQTFPNVDADDLVKARIFRIDDAFIAQAAKHGFTNLPFEKLVQLRISGIFDDESVKP